MLSGIWLFCIIGNFVPYNTKTLREDAHSRELKYVACATALGARVSQAKLFVLFYGILHTSIMKYDTAGHPRHEEKKEI